MIEALTFFLSFLLLQKSFHADVVSVMRKALKEEELLPEELRPTSQAGERYVKVSFPHKSPTVLVYFQRSTFQKCPLEI